jgi:hypothetical protein
MSTLSYSEKLRDPRWQRLRLEVMQRDGFACRDCGASDKTLHVHHCHYVGSAPWMTPPGLLLTLCADCHESRGELESDAKTALAWLMSRMGHAQDDEELMLFAQSLMSAADKADFHPALISHEEMCDLADLAREGQRAFQP